MHCEPGILAVLVALGHLVLADAGAAARAPRHRVVALVDPAALVALGQEAPDQVVVLVAEGEVAATEIGHAEPSDEHLDGVGDRPVRALDRRLGPWRFGEQLGEAPQLIGVVPVHPEPEALALLSLAGRVRQDALLAEADELGDPEGLDVPLAGEPEITLDVHLDPQALAVEAVLVALVLAEHRVEALEHVLVGPSPGMVDAHRVVRRDRAVEEAPAWFAGQLGSEPGERAPLAPELQDLVLHRHEIGARGYGTEHATSSGSVGRAGIRLVGGARPRSPTVRVSYPRCCRATRRRRGQAARGSWPPSSRCSSPGSATSISAPIGAVWASPPHRCSSARSLPASWFG